MPKDPAAVKLGRKGGQSKSPRKQAAVRANVAKAREFRHHKHDFSQFDFCEDCGARQCVVIENLLRCQNAAYKKGYCRAHQDKMPLTEKFSQKS